MLFEQAAKLPAMPLAKLLLVYLVVQRGRHSNHTFMLFSDMVRVVSEAEEAGVAVATELEVNAAPLFADWAATALTKTNLTPTSCLNPNNASGLSKTSVTAVVVPSNTRRHWAKVLSREDSMAAEGLILALARSTHRTVVVIWAP